MLQFILHNDKMKLKLQKILAYYSCLSERGIQMVAGKDSVKLLVNEKWCKGCGICVCYCPKNVLQVKKGKVEIVDIEACIKCGLCEQRCPDYAIYLKEDK